MNKTYVLTIFLLYTNHLYGMDNKLSLAIQAQTLHYQSPQSPTTQHYTIVVIPQLGTIPSTAAGNNLTTNYDAQNADYERHLQHQQQEEDASKRTCKAGCFIATATIVTGYAVAALVSHIVS